MGNKYKYNAFISYRHISPDKEIADKLQKKLENYKPPRSLSNGKRSGGWRVFRDETELPTSSNLSNDIKMALENSEYLIVICSKATSESRWCMEEIEYFKQLHNGNNSNIITLVADGNPEDVFPPALCNELIPVTDEFGNTTYQNHVIEPLAANVSGKSLKESLKKLNTEFLRIVAPILGCGYDDLYNREQKKRVRRMLAVVGTIMALLLLFGIYNSAMLWEINNQKRNARINNSEILANQAKVYMEEGNDYAAIETALKALAEEGKEILPNPKAEFVLSKSLNTYTMDHVAWNAKISLVGQGKFVEFSEDGTRLLATDTVGNIYIIDYQKNRIIKVYTPREAFGTAQDYIYDICVDGNNGLVLGGGQLISIDLDTGNINWSRDFDKELKLQKMVTNPDAEYVFVVGTILGVRTSYMLFDKHGREILYRENTDSLAFTDFAYMDSSGNVYNIQPSVGRIYIVTPKGNCVYDVDFSGGKVITAYEDENCIYINLEISTDENDVSKNNYAKLYCINKNEMSIQWATAYEFDHFIDSIHYSTMFGLKHNLPNEEGDFYRRDGVLVVLNMQILCFDRYTGELYYNAHDEREIIFCEPKVNTVGVTIVGPNHVIDRAYLMVAGTDETPRDEMVDYWRAFDGYKFDETINKVAYYDGDRFAVIIEGASDICLYHGMLSDNGTVLTELPDAFDTDLFAENGQGLFAGYYFNYSGGERVNHIGIYDLKNNKLKAYFEEPLEAIAMGFSKEGLIVFDEEGKCKVFDYSGNVLRRIDLNQRILLTKKVEEPIEILFFGMHDNTLVLGLKEGIFTIDTSSRSAAAEEIFYRKVLCNYCASGKFVSALVREINSSGELVEKIVSFIDVTNSDEDASFVRDNKSIAEFVGGSITSLVNNDVTKKIAFINQEGYIGIYEYADKKLIKIPFQAGEVLPMGIRFSPDGTRLLVLCSNGKIIKYNANEGQIEAEVQMNFEVDKYTVYDFMDEKSFYVMGSAGVSTDAMIFDLESMEQIAEVSNFVHYLKSERKILFENHTLGEGSWGYYNYKTTDELVASARAFLEKY